MKGSWISYDHLEDFSHRHNTVIHYPRGQDLQDNVHLQYCQNKFTETSVYLFYSPVSTYIQPIRLRVFHILLFNTATTAAPEVSLRSGMLGLNPGLLRCLHWQSDILYHSDISQQILDHPPHLAFSLLVGVFPYEIICRRHPTSSLTTIKCSIANYSDQ
jgi:hypothetical protein